MKNLKLKSLPVSEKDIQRQVVEGLRWKGYIVLEIGKARASVECYKCGNTFPPKGWQGNTPGTPDLLVTRDTWPIGVWLGVEVKSATGKLRTEQAELCERGRIVVVRSFDDAQTALSAFEAHIAVT